jgi:tetratricopeptide (TPR) repeat protein
MADRLEDLLRACTVRVTGGPMPGAGFFVAPGMVLTCAHVIGDSNALVVRWERDSHPTLEASVSSRVAVLAGKGRPIPALDREYPDIAVLQVSGLEGHPCVGIDPEWPSLEDSFQIFGYPEEGGAVQLTPARLTYRGTHGTLPTAYLDLASDKIKPGMSGAAVLNLRPGAVCGVVVASKHTAHPDGALAIPWTAIGEDLGAVLAANRAFHATDQRWKEAASSRRERLRFRLPRVAAHFAGRKDLLARLETSLHQQKAGVMTQVISGLGGVGKTQLAAAYAAAHQDEFDIAVWVRAHDGGIADLADLAVALALPVAGRTPPERASDVLVFLANTDRSWFLVLDDVPGPEALIGLPTSGPGQVLVTSRHRAGYNAFGAELAVDVFDADTARRYLLTRSGRTDQETGDADAVAAALGYLPLALTHAGAYCASGTGVPFSEYLELLKEDVPSQELFDTNPDAFYEHTVAATWNTSITAATQRAPLARPALEMTAYLAPEAIPRSFFAVLAENSATGRKRVAHALTTLHSYSLVTVTDNRISIHRLLQKVVRDRLSGDDQARAGVHALTSIKRALPGDPRLPATWPQWQELAPHVAVLATANAVADHHAAELVQTLNPTCEFLLSSGSFRRALDLAAQAVSFAASHLGSGHPITLTAEVNLASSLRMAGRIGEAVTLGERVAAETERLLGLEHPITLGARVSLAGSYQLAGRTGEAIALGERVAAQMERLLGREHPAIMIAQTIVASAYQAAGRTDQAIALGERVAADTENLLGPGDPLTLGAQFNLTLSYQLAGRTDQAIALGERVAADAERMLGPDHPDSLATRVNLAFLYRLAGRGDEAVAVCERAAADCERLLGPDHPTTLTARHVLALSHELARRAGEPIATAEQAVTETERQLGPDHPDTIAARLNLASSYRSAGHTDNAIALSEQLTTEAERLLGPDHPATLAAGNNLALSYQLAGRTGEAIAIGKRLAADRRRLFGSGGSAPSPPSQPPR